MVDQVYWYKAEGHPDFKIGSPATWEFSEKNYQEKNKDTTEQTLANASSNKRNKDRYSVVKNL